MLSRGRRKGSLRTRFLNASLVRIVVSGPCRSWHSVASFVSIRTVPCDNSSLQNALAQHSSRAPAVAFGSDDHTVKPAICLCLDSRVSTTATPFLRRCFMLLCNADACAASIAHERQFRLAATNMQNANRGTRKESPLSWRPHFRGPTPRRVGRHGLLFAATVGTSLTTSQPSSNLGNLASKCFLTNAPVAEEPTSPPRRPLLAEHWHRRQ